MSEKTATYISINSTYNNTSVTIHKSDGLILFSVTAGALGFKKSKRSTSYAAQSCGEKVAQYLSNLPQTGVSSSQKLTVNSESVLQQPNKKDVAQARVKTTASSGSSVLAQKNTDSQATTKKRAGQRPSARGVVNHALASSKLAQLYVCVNGVGTGKYSVIRGLIKGGVKIKKIIDITSIPHNGCRPPKQRRL